MVVQNAGPISFQFLPSIPVEVQQHHGQISSDAGLLPLREFDEKWSYTQRMAQCLDDPKPQRGQSLLSMLRQRFYGILADYEDCNDHDTLRDDPVFKIIAGRLPDGKPLASQPTLSRFENLPTPAVLQKLIDFNITIGIERLKQKHDGRLPAFVTLDLDPTDDPTHGNQQLTLFNGFYEQFQYYPLIISEPTTKHVFVAWLRCGTAKASLGADDDLMRVVKALRAERPDIVIHVRGDAGFGVPMMYEVCEENGLLYTFGFSSNARLKRLTEDLLHRAEKQYAETNEKARLFECFQYRADGWEHDRTIAAKAECHAQGTNRRFVITNVPASCPFPNASSQVEPGAMASAEALLPGASRITTAVEGEMLYDSYIQRGESEHRMDELKNGLHMDRLSCHRFMANFFRLQLHKQLTTSSMPCETIQVFRRYCVWDNHARGGHT